ncbi:uncharacterized protein CTRU02_203724 [Colletotrichum truncatum]|uniref:Uncharacterized protein n=1 Tax=Colletotrichum truncatum TaxID=5467 RepID=A0ACC3ZA33_COLTU|nr:uncharacterized protein CTRU02_04058 [Colletotrichum truncatum]KAF6796097.1 hypothetical protein CTRU02_04058 [Colletotrichum truncatum]
MPNLRPAYPDAFLRGCSRKDCFRSSASPDCEFHCKLVRDIIRSRREGRRARLQQRCRAQSGETVVMAAAAAAVSASRNVTPLRRQLSQSSKPDSPSSTTSSEFSPCVSPLMEDLLLEVTDAIESSGADPYIAMAPQRPPSVFDMHGLFELIKLIEEAQRDYEGLVEPPAARERFNLAFDPSWNGDDCFGNPAGHS